MAGLRPVCAAVALLVLLALAPGAPIPTHPVAAAPYDLAPGSHVPGVVHVRFKRSVASTGSVAQYRALAREEVAPGLGAMLLRVRPGTEADVIRELRADPSVELAVPDVYFEVQASFPTDPGYAVDNADANCPLTCQTYYRWALQRTKVPEAWDTARGRADMTIGVIDTGADLNHPDLAGRLLPGTNLVLGEEGRNEHDPRNGHGTGVAGMIAANPNNGLHTAGINWSSKILMVRAANDQGRIPASQLIAAIRFVGERGIRILNLSIAMVADSDPSDANLVSDAIHQYLVPRGVLTVSAMGNVRAFSQDSQARPPATFPIVMGVSGTKYVFYENGAFLSDPYEDISDISNRGNWVSVAAPGQWVTSLYGTATPGCVESLTDPYCSTEGRAGLKHYWSGTSFATPVVVGIASLVWGCHPGLTAAQVRSVLERSADKVGRQAYDASGRNSLFGYGRVNAERALQTAAALARSVLAISAPAGYGFRLHLPLGPRSFYADNNGC